MAGTVPLKSMVGFSLSILLLGGPVFEDVSPNLPHGVLKSRASISGLTLAVVGDHDRLFALSLNAGVWRSDRGGPWIQLPNSSANANCIAVDPTNVRHIAVGERNGFAIDMQKNWCGVRESFDAGNHWRRTLDPLEIPGCRSQAVSSVAFDPYGNLYAATSVGIGVRRGSKGTFDFSASPTGSGLVTCISITRGAVWARTIDKIMASPDAGRSWQVHDIPQTVGPDKISFSSRGDAFSLAATPQIEMMPCILTPGVGGNRNSLLAYNPALNEWHTQTLTSGNGTGLGGRRFAKSYDDTLLYGAGQEIHQSLIHVGVVLRSQLQFDTPVQTNWGGPYGTPPHEIHSDTWDMHLDPAFGKSNYDAWISCDGGVFASSPNLRSPNAIPSRLFDHQWLPHNDGLHTHHVHTITALEMPGDKARLAYPTSDNDAFYYDPQKGWMNEEWLGDVNWTAGDIGNPNIALMVRRSAGFAMLTAFRNGIPMGAHFEEDQAITLCNNEHYDGPTSFAFIQTLRGEKPVYPLLDAVRLVDLPLQVYDDQHKLIPAPGSLGDARPTPVLIRNRTFAASPDANGSKYLGWQIERQNLPAGTTAFWVSGGHAEPTYYVFTRGHLYRSQADGWKELSNVSGGKRFELLPGNQFGAVFVNPYNPKVIYALATDGVKMSRDGGESFENETELTALLTEGGKYPIAVGELTGNGRGVVLATRANTTATLAQVAFDREHPETAVACSPFTGVMVAKNGKAWKSYRRFLPSPLSAIVSVAIANGSIYCASEGRGVFRIKNYR